RPGPRSSATRPRTRRRRGHGSLRRSHWDGAQRCWAAPQNRALPRADGPARKPTLARPLKGARRRRPSRERQSTTERAHVRGKGARRSPLPAPGSVIVRRVPDRVLRNGPFVVLAALLGASAPARAAAGDGTDRLFGGPSLCPTPAAVR